MKKLLSFPIWARFRSARNEEAEEHRPWSAIALITPYFRRYGVRVGFGFVSLLTVDFLQLWIPRIIKKAVDDLQYGRATSLSLLKYGGIILLIALAIAVLRFLWRHLLLGFSRLVEMHLRNRMIAHILTLDKAFLQRRTTGEIMALATNDLASVQLASGMGMVAAVDAIFMGLAAFAFMAYIHLELTLIAIAPMPILAILTRFLSSRLHQRFKRVQEQFSALTEFARSTFSTIRLVKAYNQEERQSERFDRMGETYVRNNLRLASVYGTLFPLSGFIGNLSLLLVLFFGGRLTIAETISAGDFVAFIAYLFMIIWPMMAVGWVADLFQRGVTSLDRIRSLLEEKPSLVVSAAPAESFNPRGAIEVKGLSFAYPNQSQTILKDLSLSIKPGSFIGIVGRTGSGKTTLCNVLARFYPVPDGKVFFDGIDVNRLPLSGLRGAIAYVPQDVVLFSESIVFNITMGKKDASQEEIEAAAKAAAIHEEIMAMSEGYRTRIGERGVRLSGGQRQRIAIARALLLDRPIIIIDDGLSAVDMETEHAIIRTIADYLKGKTCIVTSHRVAPLADAHEIVVMEGGRIVHRGTHVQLLKQSKYYETIFKQQVSARISE